jgi:redox-sensitive bicupin YhaK (pirin superfamily)
MSKQIQETARDAVLVRGAWHAEGIGEDEIKEGLGDTEFRGVLFWMNLARKDKKVQPSALVVQPEEIPVRQDGEAIVRVLVEERSPVQLGTPALILDIELPEGGQVTTKVPAEFLRAHFCSAQRLTGARLLTGRHPGLRFPQKLKPTVAPPF